ncbi:hypothetical protein SK128_014837 [Halocaridina rubra]|uniref:Uncharacterized protein n=1 Tax=Halocaridina rubra TaxID=373956 RepID=A0AAN9A554_HALRR
MGGGASFLYAATFPEKTKKIVMVDLIKPISVQPEKQPKRSAKSIKELLSAEANHSRTPLYYDYETIINRMIKGYNDSLTEESAKILMKRGTKQHKNGQYSFTFDPRIKVANLLSMTVEQQKAFAQNLQCKMLIIKASAGPWYEDKAVYDEMLSIYREKTEVFKFVTLEGSHHIHLNNPELAAPVIFDFLKDT